MEMLRDYDNEDGGVEWRVNFLLLRVLKEYFCCFLKLCSHIFQYRACVHIAESYFGLYE